MYAVLFVRRRGELLSLGRAVVCRKFVVKWGFGVNEEMLFYQRMQRKMGFASKTSCDFLHNSQYDG